MISTRIRKLCGLYWPDPYAQPKPEPPLPDLIDLLDRAKHARAEVANMTIAADMNRNSR